MSHKVNIHDIKQVTHDVKQFRFEKPEGYSFEPGQATEVSINKEGWKEANHPFTFTSLQEDPELQFVIKIYSEHKGLTEQIGELREGDQFIIHDVWGAIQYKGPGIFLAGGAGVTPFIAIFRRLARDNEVADNKLIFSNKTENDIILRDEFEEMLGENFINTLTDQDHSDRYLTEFIDKNFLQKHIDNFNRPFYICGPPSFVDDMKKHLKELGAKPEGLVFEQ